MTGTEFLRSLRTLREQQRSNAVRAALIREGNPDGDELRCPCVGIYTKCHYPDKHGRLPR